MHPQSFLRLPNGHVLATLQKQHDSLGVAPGGVAELTNRGQFVRSVSADRTDRRIRPYSAVIVPTRPHCNHHDRHGWRRASPVGAGAAALRPAAAPYVRPAPGTTRRRSVADRRAVTPGRRTKRPGVHIQLWPLPPAWTRWTRAVRVARVVVPQEEGHRWRHSRHCRTLLSRDRACVACHGERVPDRNSIDRDRFQGLFFSKGELFDHTASKIEEPFPPRARDAPITDPAARKAREFPPGARGCTLKFPVISSAD